MVLWVFDGNMVGKWTNEPCNGADEAVNPFWVLTSPPRSAMAHMNVSPRASSILYHFFGKSDNVDGNRCGHVRSCLLLTPKKGSLPHLPHYMAHLSIFLPYFHQKPIKPSKNPPKGLKCLQKAIKPSFPPKNIQNSSKKKQKSPKRKKKYKIMRKRRKKP